MPREPDVKRAVSFVDGQNLFRHAKDAFGHYHPNFSQDQDLVEVAVEVRDIARAANRWLKVASAFPSGPNATSRQGIHKTDWFKMDKAFYDACLDPRDYRSA